MSKFAKFWPILVTLIAAAAPFISAPVNAFWSAHPEVVSVIAAAWASLKFLLPSPVSNAK